jgi:peptidoglycan/xylan/chitin deacetylase (PgdA/CDA1 family)
VWTPLLDALAATDARATFFLIDEHITDETRSIVRRIAEEGHAIGLHSGTRRLMIGRRPTWPRFSIAMPDASRRSPAGSRAGCFARTPGGGAARCTAD